MKSLIIFVFLMGIIFIIYDQQEKHCAPPRIEYRYLPQTFNQEQYQQMPIMATYGDLFYKPTPFEESIGYPGVFFNKKDPF
jgi:hypothetical protein